MKDREPVREAIEKVLLLAVPVMAGGLGLTFVGAVVLLLMGSSLVFDPVAAMTVAVLVLLGLGLYWGARGFPRLKRRRQLLLGAAIGNFTLLLLLAYMMIQTIWAAMGGG